MKLKFNFNSVTVVNVDEMSRGAFVVPLWASQIPQDAWVQSHFSNGGFSVMPNATQTSLPEVDISLAHLPVGARARVLAVSGTGAVTRRLMEMGLVPGAHVRMVKSAPLGDPLEVRVRGYHLAVRRAEAQTITVVTSAK